MKLNKWNNAKEILARGGVIVAPTDTLYGVLARASDKKAVTRVYAVKGRDTGKPCIVLITSFDQLTEFGLTKLLHVDGDYYRFLSHIWPDKISVVLPCKNAKYKYLHRGTDAIAFRMVSPKNKNLYALIEHVGPLVAPSANPEGLSPARTIKEAQTYFTNTVDLYVDGGIKDSPASTLVSLLGPKPKILRQGSVTI